MGSLATVSLQAVARHVSGTVVPGRAGTLPHLVVDGRPVALAVQAVRARPATRGTGDPRLRFDRVALRLMRDLEASAAVHVPAGVAVVVTVTAPIRQSGRTARALDDDLRALMASPRTARERRLTRFENAVRLRVVPRISSAAPRILTFVHNPDSDATLLLDTAAEMLALTTAARRAATRGRERWLVLARTVEPDATAAYRHLWSRLAPLTGCTRALLVAASGRVHDL